MQKALIAIGIACLLAGLLWPWLAKLPLGRLPGDIRIEKPGLVLFFPITSLLLVSLVVSLAAWLLRKW
ncbi:MAG: DUF2905 domain-containing protein [Verrucomicrobiales bacterium]|nr:DUF2905 domain-containing protein [Verrucomicrobiales bacterium]